MANLVMLNHVAHKNLRALTRFGAELGDQVGMTVIFPNEFASVQREYPIFFRKDKTTGEYQSVALLGFQKDENLFLDGQRWTGKYIPAAVARGPFLIGYQDQRKDGRVQREPVIHVDLDSPRVSKSEGEALFAADGSRTPYLDYVSNLLGAIQTGLELSNQMFQLFNELQLIEPLQMELQVGAKEGIQVVGLQTINYPKLAGLESAPLDRLHKTGFLECAFLQHSSVSNVNRLLAMKQRAAARRQ